MYPEQEIKKFLYFDLETVGQTNNFEELKEENPRLATLFEKRCKAYLFDKEGTENISHLWQNNAGLHPEFGKIVCASFGYFNPSTMEPILTSYYGDDEKDLLTTSRKLLRKVDQEGYSLCGHYIKGFDIPYLAKRMIINGMMPPLMIQTHNKKPWEIKHLDTKEMWSFGSYGQSFASLDLVTCSLDIESPKDKMAGDMVHSEYYDKNNIEGIKEYCEKDVLALMRMLQKVSSLEQ